MNKLFLLLSLPLMAFAFFSFSSAKKCTRVVFFGDSITEFAVEPGGYISRIGETLEAKGLGKQYKLMGAGISGNKVYDLYLRLEEDVLAKKPDVVYMYVGVNDVWHKQMFGTGTDPDKFRKFYLAMIRKFQSKGIKVVVCTPACIGEKHSGENAQDADLDLFSGIIREVAKEKQLLLCDFREAFMTYSKEHNPEDQDKNILTSDGVHLNAKGNRLVADMMLEKLLKTGK